MKLTGKAKEDFKEWLFKFGDGTIRFPYNAFKAFPESMQIGVYVDFFTEKGIRPSLIDKWPVYQIQFSLYDGDIVGISNSFPSLSEVRTAAIEKACEIYNSKL